MLFVSFLSCVAWVNLLIVDGITPENPCDPMQSNITAQTVLKGSMFDVMMELNISPKWFHQPMNYVNCSRRGLEKIPITISSHVEILDLSSNVISQIQKTISTRSNILRFCGYIQIV